MERSTIDELLYIGNIANLRAVLDLPWLQDAITETEYEVIYQLQALDYWSTQAAAAVIGMPFLASTDTTDVLALQGMTSLADEGTLSTLTNHPAFQDGITEDEATLVAAVGTLYGAPDEIQKVLYQGVAAIETVALGTKLTPSLKISIIRTDGQSRLSTIEATRDFVEFVEEVMGLPLPVDHVVIVLNDRAVSNQFVGTNYGFAFSYLPEYEIQQDAFKWQHLQLGFVHEIAHYYWTGNEDWMDEGMATIIEYIFGRQNGLSSALLQPQREDCEAHDLAMLSVWAPALSNPQYGCTYYLGQLFFQELLESMDFKVFREKVGELYRLTLEGQAADRTPGIAEVRQVFSGQADIIDQHWAGRLNAQENRPLDEGVERLSHGLIQWEQYPTYDERGFVTLKGVLLGDSVLATDPTEEEYSNFSLTRADEHDYLGSILPPLPDDSYWILENPGDTVALNYFYPTERSFLIEFPFPTKLDGDPSDYVVVVWGFEDSNRRPTTGDDVDIIGYARIRIL